MPDPIYPLNLYALDADLADLERELLEAGGEVDDETEARHNALLDAREDKIEAYVALIRRLSASADAVEAERKRLQNAEKALKNAAQRMKDRLLDSMQRRGETQQQTRLGTVRVQQASRRAVQLRVDVDHLPDRFVKVRPPEVNLSALREALDAGDEEAATLAELAPATSYVRIY
ncbi:MAG: siphovirus Gp157 family protein [Bacteroidota bacterium]